MQFKTRALVAALAFVAAGAANAAINTAGSKNSDLILFVTSKSSAVSAVFDLGVDFNTIMTAKNVPSATWVTAPAGAKVVWDLNASTVVGNEALNLSTAVNYGSTMQDFLAASAGATDIVWGVLASAKYSSTDVRALQTVNTADLAKVGNTTKANELSFSTTFDKIAANYNAVGTNATATNGASMSATTAWQISNMLGTTYNWAAKSTYSVASADGATANFVYTDSTSANTLVTVNNLRNQNEFAHFTFNSANGTLVYSVPEPETYAMLLAGLGMIGFMARRRSM